MNNIKDEAFEELIRKNKFYERANVVLIALTLGFAIALAAVLIFTPNC